ncbi:putative ATP-dependent endonuclease of OLD family [Novosphingobium sp. 1529]|uniref:ATP-dependent nuclease n=1 Tax=Novosphingobium sp. 1529 TaxID=3156424 RepID=UPI00339515BD
MDAQLCGIHGQRGAQSSLFAASFHLMGECVSFRLANGGRGMKITKFVIKNFKGIANTTINVCDDTPGNVSTLIGLNESGKTTILEAISHFVTEDKDTAGLVRTVTKKSDLQDLIPKDRKAAFTGSTSIIGSVILEESDVTNLENFFLSNYELVLDTQKLRRNILIERSYKFLDSTLEETNTYWTISFSLKTKRAKKYNLYRGYAGESKEYRTIWLAAVDFLRNRTPKIVYFPTFLFDFPDRIYLKGENSEINSYYKQVIQDVLDSQGDGLDVQKHIIDRIDKAKSEHPNIATFFSYFFQRDEKKQIDAVLQKASNEMSNVIFGSWNQILSRNITGKRVQIDWLLDGDKSNAPYLEISIVDGQSKYSLSERSLGFRWFFSFLLFTEFRRNRNNSTPTLFLFDEPAANLHSKAQIKLLESFSRIAKGTTHIIYSTHSHYMVNPLWLEKAYIVENKATDYDNEDDVDAFSIRKTDIKATKYKTFVGSNPTKTTYFQPVLDALEVPFSPLIGASKALIVEGKNDYFPIVFLRQKLTGSACPQIFPANGAGSAGPLVSLFRGWGIDFRILLDDDKAGKAGKKAYINDYFLRDSEVVTIGDLSPTLSGQTFEAVYKNDTINAVISMFSIEAPKKRDFSLFFQDLIVSNNDIDLKDTLIAFEPISKWIDEEFL